MEKRIFPMRPLGWLSPREFIKKYKSQEELSQYKVLKVYIFQKSVTYD